MSAALSSVHDACDGSSSLKALWGYGCERNGPFNDCGSSCLIRPVRLEFGGSDTLTITTIAL